jgi:hypothetical protein
MWGYLTKLHYEIHDQLGSFMLDGVTLPINEQWTTGLQKDASYPNTNWQQSMAKGTTTSTSAFDDTIEGEHSNKHPSPIYDPTNTQRVVYWGQAWQVGSLSIGAGKRVQTDTLQKNLGRALHTNIVSPP